MSKSKLSINMNKENDVDNKLEEDRIFVLPYGVFQL